MLGCKSSYIFLVVYSPEQVSGFVAVTVGRIRVFYGSGAATQSMKDQGASGDKSELERWGCVDIRCIFKKILGDR